MCEVAATNMILLKVLWVRREELMKIYLEYKDNNSYKFWEVSVEGDY